MPNIFTSRYLRDAPPAKPENYVRYIRTREGVEKAEGADRNFLRQSGRKIGSTRSSVIFWQQMKCWNIRIFYFSPLGKTLRSLSLAPLSRTLT